MNNVLDDCDCEVYYRGELLAVTTTDGRNDVVHQAIREGRISLPFGLHDLEFKWRISKNTK